MENLKFRAWHKEEKKYYEVDSLIIKSRTVLCGLISHAGVSFFTPRLYSYDDVIIEQYTGLKDKNGKEIYVGDILMEIEYKEKGVVALNNGSYSVDWGYGFKLMSESVRYNVVGGNVHEHGDFL